MRLVFLMGPPESGKWTVAKHLSKHVISPGATLRELEKTDTDVGVFIRNNWNHSSLVPIVNEIVKQQLQRHAQDTERLVVVDGFPRTEEEALYIPVLANGSQVLAIELDMSDDTIRRIQKVKRQRSQPKKAREIRDNSYVQNMSVVRSILQEQGVYRSVDANKDEITTIESCEELINDPRPWKRLPPCQDPNDAHLGGHTALKACTPLETAAVIQSAIRLAKASKKHKHFPGMHPVSLERSHLQKMDDDLLLSVKADGQRYLCLVRNSKLYFLSRRLVAWKGYHHEALGVYEDSLLDVEFIADTNGSSILVLDVIAMNGNTLESESLIQRLESSVDLGREALCKLPVRVDVQKYWSIRDHEQAFTYYERNAEGMYDTDGIVFTPNTAPYKLGMNVAMWKWKPPEANTIDFLFEEQGRRLFLLDTFKKDEKGLVAVGELSERQASRLKDGAIAECAWSYETEEWIVVRFRTDKTSPNAEWVGRRVLRSISDRIEYEELRAVVADFVSKHCGKVEKVPRFYGGPKVPQQPTGFCGSDNQSGSSALQAEREADQEVASSFGI